MIGVRNLTAGLTVGIAVTAAVSIAELSHIFVGDRALFIASRLISLGLFSVLVILLRQGYNRSFTHDAFGALIYLHCFQGQFYRPSYVIVLAQLQLVHALFFCTSTKRFLLIHGVGSTAFLVWEYYLRGSQHRYSSFADEAVILLVFVSISVLAHRLLSKGRLFKDQAATRRFSLIGQHAASLIHDVRSLAAAPQLYAALLVERTGKLVQTVGAEKDEMDLRQIVTKLHSDLERLNTLVHRLYDVTDPRDYEQNEQSIRELALTAIEILGSRSTGIAIDVQGDAIRKVNGPILQLVFLNLLYNSLDTFQARDITQPKIRILIEKQKIRFSDNAGGFDAKTLKQLKRNSLDESDTGLGLVIVRNSIVNLGARLSCENAEFEPGQLGAELTISFI